MVIPGYGLQYPFGIFNAGVNIVPDNNRDYSNVSGTCYYYRKFNNPNDQVRFGGTFIFDNLTLKEFNSDNLTLEISIDAGKSWLNCKKQRQIFREEYDENRYVEGDDL